MPMNNESTPPPMIGKIGPYTVFVTPPATPNPSQPLCLSPSPNKTVSPQPPSFPVQPPPNQLSSTASVHSPSGDSTLGFFWNAVSKVQNVHSNLDDYVAHWFGLNQSKYQWALDNYYENKGVDQVAVKARDLSSKIGSA